MRGCGACPARPMLLMGSPRGSWWLSIRLIDGMPGKHPIWSHFVPAARKTYTQNASCATQTAHRPTGPVDLIVVTSTVNR